MGRLEERRCVAVGELPEVAASNSIHTGRATKYARIRLQRQRVAVVSEPDTNYPVRRKGWDHRRNGGAVFRSTTRGL